MSGINRDDDTVTRPGIDQPGRPAPDMPPSAGEGRPFSRSEEQMEAEITPASGYVSQSQTRNEPYAVGEAVAPGAPVPDPVNPPRPSADMSPTAKKHYTLEEVELPATAEATDDAIDSGRQRDENAVLLERSRATTLADAEASVLSDEERVRRQTPPG